MSMTIAVIQTGPQMFFGLVFLFSFGLGCLSFMLAD
jgi:hypothetical protein